MDGQERVNMCGTPVRRRNGWFVVGDKKDKRIDGDTCTANPIWNKAIVFPHHLIDGLFLDLLRPPFRVNGKEVIGCTLVANRPVVSRRHVRFADTYFGGRSFRAFHDGLFLDLFRSPFRVNGKEVIGCTLVANRPVASRRHVRFADTYFGGRSFRGFHDLPSVLTEGRSSSDHFADGKDRL